MGCNVAFFAFDECPDVKTLESISWLTAFRLFHRQGRAEWYLEGPSAVEHEVTFSERLGAEYSSPAAIALASAALAKLRIDIKALNARSAGYDDEGLLQALALSEALKQRVLYIAGNDESLDCGFICKDGAIVRGRLALDWNKAAAIENGTVRIESLYPDGMNPHTAEPKGLYALASHEAAEFFRSKTPWPISSDPADFESAHYQLVGSKGTASAPLHEIIRAELEAVWASSNKPAEKLRRYVAIIAPHIDTALRADLILAERKSRDPTERVLLRCNLFMASEYRGKSPQIAALAALLSDVMTYLRLIRPRPRFRQKIDFRAMNKQLTWRWRTMRVTIAIRARLSF